MTNFNVTQANKQYNHLSHDFEIAVTTNTIFREIKGDAYRNVDISFKITKISAVTNADVGKCFGQLVFRKLSLCLKNISF